MVGATAGRTAASPGPTLDRVADAGKGGRRRGEAELCHLGLERRRQGVHQARNRIEEGGVRHHRRHHGAHAGIAIGLGAGGQARLARGGKLEGEIVAGGAALQQHLGGTDIGGKVLVLLLARAPDPGCGGQQQLQGPAIPHPLGEIAVAVGMAVDQPGMHQHARRVEDRGVIRCRETRRPELDDRAILDQDVGERCGVRVDVDETAAADDGHGHAGTEALLAGEPR